MMLEEQLKEQLEERKKKWWGWHKENPQVWEKFEEYTLEAIATGRNHYSHWAIVNRIRWNREIETKGGEFKISNDYICFYARLTTPCLLYTSPSPRDRTRSRMPSSA